MLKLAGSRTGMIPGKRKSYPRVSPLAVAAVVNLPNFITISIKQAINLSYILFWQLLQILPAPEPTQFPPKPLAFANS
jgi:hypothetical protein